MPNALSSIGIILELLGVIGALPEILEKFGYGGTVNRLASRIGLYKNTALLNLSKSTRFSARDLGLGAGLFGLSVLWIGWIVADGATRLEESLFWLVYGLTVIGVVLAYVVLSVYVGYRCVRHLTGGRVLETRLDSRLAYMLQFAIRPFVFGLYLVILIPVLFLLSVFWVPILGTALLTRPAVHMAARRVLDVDIDPQSAGLIVSFSLVVLGLLLQFTATVAG